jgi:hypothetical protein
MPCAAESAEAARGLVRTALAAWSLELLIENGSLIVTELVANAVIHTGCCSIRVLVARPAPDRVRIGVVDKSRVLPVRREPKDDDVRGRGLALVEALSLQWGTDLKRWGKCVWADLKTDEAP